MSNEGLYFGTPAAQMRQRVANAALRGGADPEEVMTVLYSEVRQVHVPTTPAERLWAWRNGRKRPEGNGE